MTDDGRYPAGDERPAIRSTRRPAADRGLPLLRFAALTLLPAACGPTSATTPDTAEDVDVAPDQVANDTAEDADVAPDRVADEGEADAPRLGYGEPCTDGRECEGRFCITPDIDPSFVGGYCSAVGCDPFFEGACGATATCFDAEMFLPLCAKLCETDADCRTPDYVCIGTCIPVAFTATLDRPGTLDGAEADILGLVDAIDDDRMMRRVRVLAGEDDWDGPSGPVRIVSRAPEHPDHAAAIDYLDAELTAMGLTVERHPFTSRDIPCTNLTADIAGADPSLPPIILMGHYDSIAIHTPGWDPATGPAPGAVDNGSGVVIALEIATLLASGVLHSPARTVRILLTDDEEYGLNGAEAYVADLAAAGVETACTLNVDMIAWSMPATAGRFWYLFSEASRPYAALGAEAIDLFVPAARPIHSGFTAAGNGDHAAFWEGGFCAIGMASFPRARSNHSVDDVSSEFDPAFFHNAARAAAAVVAAWAYHS